MITKLKVYFWTLLNFRSIKKGKYLSSKETISELSFNNKSLIRWGDGETEILFEKSLYFQKYDKSLKQKLQKILEYNFDDKILLAIPTQYISKNIFYLQKIRKLKTWAYTRYIIKKYLKKNSLYGDAFIFRPESTISNENIIELWKNKIVIIVSSDQKDFENFNLRNSNNAIKHINIPYKDSYDHYQDILDSIVKNTPKKNLSEVRVLISAGPTAKVLVYDLVEYGIIAYDIGHYFKWKFKEKNYQEDN